MGNRRERARKRQAITDGFRLHHQVSPGAPTAATSSTTSNGETAPNSAESIKSDLPRGAAPIGLGAVPPLVEAVPDSDISSVAADEQPGEATSDVGASAGHLPAEVAPDHDSSNAGERADEISEDLTGDAVAEPLSKIGPAATGSEDENQEEAQKWWRLRPLDQNEHLAFLRPRDPIILRDARPFSAEPGARAFTLPWPLPRTVAGAIRTYAGNQEEGPWTRERSVRVQKIVVQGPLLAGRTRGCQTWDLYVPAPRDVVFFHPDGNQQRINAMALRPRMLRPGEGVSEPDELRVRPSDDNGNEKPGYQAALNNCRYYPLSVTEDVKPAKAPMWWRLDDAAEWLLHRASKPGPTLPIARKVGPEKILGVNALKKDARVHVSIDPDKKIAREGALFTTEALAFPDGYNEAHDEPEALAIIAKLTWPEKGSSDPAPSPPAWPGGEASLPLGGETRLVYLSEPENEIGWPDPDFSALSDESLKTVKGLRLQLVTPAFFNYGWLPSWLGHEGTIPGLGGSKLGVCLVGAAMDRRVPVSGWRARVNDAEGARKTRYAVPAGSVYFFVIERGCLTVEILKKLWLRPISDRPGDCNDGFGLALPGLWTPSEGLIKNVQERTKK